MLRILFAFFLGMPGPLLAGLYYSEEHFADGPSRWRGYLLDHAALRRIAAKPTASAPASFLRLQYQKEASRLSSLARQRPLTPSESADLGALWIRLGEADRAVEILRPAQRSHPDHFQLTANLGTAWHRLGQMPQALSALEQSVRLAPPELKPAERLHLALVRSRNAERSDTPGLDPLVVLPPMVTSGDYRPGPIPLDSSKGPTNDTVNLVQRLGLWFPDDARLLWLMAELANLHGDFPMAAAMMDGCVTEFGLRDPRLLAHRHLLRDAADRQSRDNSRAPKKDHDEHLGWFKPRANRPLVKKVVLEGLPPIDSRGVNLVPWDVIAETTVDRQARPTFHSYLRDLDGKKVQMKGYMQPLGDDTDLGAFLFIEHPVGCWFCEMPQRSYIILVELPEGQSGRFSRERLRVTGKFLLNASDPENFFYVIRDAKVEDDATP